MVAPVSTTATVTVSSVFPVFVSVKVHVYVRYCVRLLGVHPAVDSWAFDMVALACGLKICWRKGKTANMTTMTIRPSTTTMRTRGISVPVEALAAIREGPESPFLSLYRCFEG